MPLPVILFDVCEDGGDQYERGVGGAGRIHHQTLILGLVAFDIRRQQDSRYLGSG